jgi:hypothetical protein
MSAIITPETGTSFTTIVFEGCKTPVLNGSKAITGKVTAIPNGATVVVNIPKNAESTLEFGGQKAGLTITGTGRGKKVGGTESPEPLLSTTTPLIIGG